MRSLLISSMAVTVLAMTFFGSVKSFGGGDDRPVVLPVGEASLNEVLRAPSLPTDIYAVPTSAWISKAIIADVDSSVLAGHTKAELDEAKDQAAKDLSQMAVGVNMQSLGNLYSEIGLHAGSLMRGSWGEKYNFITLTAAAHFADEFSKALAASVKQNELYHGMPRTLEKDAAIFQKALTALEDFIGKNADTMQGGETAPSQRAELEKVISAQYGVFESLYRDLTTLQSMHYDRFMHPERELGQMREILVLERTSKSVQPAKPAVKRMGPQPDLVITITSPREHPIDPQLIAYYKSQMARRLIRNEMLETFIYNPEPVRSEIRMEYMEKSFVDTELLHEMESSKKKSYINEMRTLRRLKKMNDEFMKNFMNEYFQKDQGDRLNKLIDSEKDFSPKFINQNN